MTRRPLRVLAPDDTVRRISRRLFLGGLAAAGSSAALAACGAGDAIAPSLDPDGEMESQLNVYTWGEYDDPDVIDAFSARHGVRVQMDNFGSNEEMMAKLGAARGTSGYDIIVPTGIYIPMMAERGLLQPLDHGLLPNLRNLSPAIADQDWDPGNEYSVCKAWGTTGYVYDRTVITRPMTSWEDFLLAAQDEASGSTTVLEDPWEVCAIWLAAQGEDVNTDDPELLQLCEDALVDSLAPHLRAFVSTATTGVVQGSFALIQAYNGDARQALMETGEPERWEFVFPTPTANLWMDNWCIAAGTQHPDAAYAFIDAMLDPEAAFAQMDYVGYDTGVVGLRERAEQEELDFPEIVFPDQEILDRLTASEYNDGMEKRVIAYDRLVAESGAA